MGVTFRRYNIFLSETSHAEWKTERSINNSGADARLFEALTIGFYSPLFVVVFLQYFPVPLS